MGMGGVALMVDAPSATIWGVIALPKRMASVGVITLIKYFAAQQVASTCPKRMEFARYMVEHEFAKFVDVQRISNVCTAIKETAMVFPAINETAMVGEDDFSNWNEDLNNLVVATILDISVIEPSHNLTFMDINDIPFLDSNSRICGDE